MKNEITEAVSSLRHYFVQIQKDLESKSEANETQALEVKACKEEIQKLEDLPSTQTEQVALSMDTERSETVTVSQVPASAGRAGKLYSEAVRSVGRREKLYRLMISSRTNHTEDAIKNIIKASLNPTSMKVGICALKSLRDGRVIMETRVKWT
jgi:hypothetical protein